MHQFQSVADELEGFAEPLIEGSLQLLIHSDSHLFQLCSILMLKLPEL